jgi:hypothetical protein
MYEILCKNTKTHQNPSLSRLSEIAEMIVWLFIFLE